MMDNKTYQVRPTQTFKAKSTEYLQSNQSYKHK